MFYLVGTDEAGYGPNLGPLVVTATVWSAPRQLDGDLYQQLDGVTRDVDPSRFDAARHLAIADSKVLYSPAVGLGRLERGVLALLAVWRRRPATWRDVWPLLCGEGAFDGAPWHDGFDAALPVACGLDHLDCGEAILRRAVDRAGARLENVRCRAVFPCEWNRLIDASGNKATALSDVALDLAAEVVADLDGPAVVVCDKHGGRARYQALLQRRFPDQLVEVWAEGRETSIYRFGPRRRRIEFRFQARGEAHLPTAAASMVAKYVRELSMRAFNAFWGNRVKDLRPTAGYPLDANRFRQDIAAAQVELAMADDVLWRRK